MVGKTKFWLRVGHWFGGPDRSFGATESVRDVDYTTAESAVEPAGRDGQQSLADNAATSTIARPLPDEDRMEQAYAKIIDLVASIQKHLELQDQRAQRMSPTLDRLAEGLSNIPKAAEKQVELLAQMTAQLEDDAEQATRIEGLLSQLPHIADAQRETTVSLGRQLDFIQESDTRNAASAEELQQVISALARAENGSTTALKQIHMDSASQGQHLAQLLTQQTRRITVLALVAIALAAAAGMIAILG